MPTIKRLLELNKNFYLVSAILWLCAITVGSLLSGNMVREVDTGFDIPDKLVHGIFYFGNTLLFYLYFRKTSLKNEIIKVSVFSFLYGILIEVLQHVMPYERSFDVKDILANTVGILIAIFLIKFCLALSMR
ncbi:VanZ family protein [Galbibacter mesophilus]|uniref:VanZ family protein n=1 Tax=Galbibacter mesophilus TaxID=379069 RepID=UPI00191D432C|nr:VanZ family protein [Galbibacter mesophilus]MCM5661875.1 VanZ family protein [Galbibacter mesophilus]